jgi:F-type H+-transporting ATPase subunit a
LPKSFFKKISILGGFFTAIAVLAAAMLAKGDWVPGILTGGGWMFLNLFFLFRLLSIAMRPAAGDAKQMRQAGILAILKFPVLYLAGFFILRSGFFEPAALLLGLSAFFAAVLAGWAMAALARTKTHKAAAVFAFILATSLASFTAFAGEAAHGGGSHETGGHEEKKEASYHILNFVHLLTEKMGHTPFSDFLHRFENVIFGVIVIGILTAIFYFASRRQQPVPGRLQAACEAIVEGLNGFVCGILGPQGKKYTPFLGTVFLYIWTMNLIGLVPLMKAPTANSMILNLGPITIPIPTTTAALAIIVFFYVQITGIKEQGIKGYLDHMAGTPRDIFGFILLPLMFVIHLIGEFAKPLSLAFRLYGNIWGEDVLLAVFMGLGIAAMAFLPVPMGAPIHFPFILLALVTGTIQAFVFTLLSTVYIAMMLPHEHGEEKHAPGGGGHAHGHGHAAH